MTTHDSDLVIDLTRADAVVIPASALSERFSRSSGPGGQGVNTTDSRVELSFNLAEFPAIPEEIRARMIARLDTRLVNGVITVVASEYRAQLANRKAARERLISLLRDAARPPAPPRRETKPSRAYHERRITAKKRRGAVKRGRNLPPSIED